MEGRPWFRVRGLEPQPIFPMTEATLPSLRIRSLVLTGLLASGWTGALHASSLVYESFSGYAAGNMGGQTITGSGLSGNYANGGAGAITYDSNGLAFSNLAVTGGSITNAGGGGSFIGASLSGSAGGTLYTSYLVRFNADPNVAVTTAAQIGLNSGTTTGGGTRYFNVMADSPAAGSVVPGFGYNFGATGETAANALVANTTFMVIAEINNVGAALSGGTVGSGTVWVLSESQFNSFKPGGFTSAELNAAAVGLGGADVWARYTTATPVTTGTYAYTGAALQLSLTPLSTSTSNMDEVRWGTTLDDVTPLAVPEPGAWAMAMCAAVALTGFRKRHAC